MENFNINEFENRDSQLHRDAISILEKNGMDPNIGYIAAFVSDIVELTELPENFEVSSKITSTTNDSVKVKWEILKNSRPELVGKFVPNNFASYPLNFEDKEVWGTAPWVNTIHTWEKVLNLMNRVSSNQKGVFQESYEDRVNMVCSISTQLYRLTVENDGNPFLRQSVSFRDSVLFEETKQRESGAKGVNASRHVCLEEMGYILKTIRDVYRKSE